MTAKAGTLDLRLSPSGKPSIGKLGVGAILRQDFMGDTQVNNALTGSYAPVVGATGTFQVAFLNPSPDLYYRVRGFFSFAGNSATVVEYLGQLFNSIVDPAASFVATPSATFAAEVTGDTGGTAGATPWTFDTGFILGSALGNPVVAATTLLTFQLQFKNNTGVATATPKSAWLCAQECLPG